MGKTYSEALNWASLLLSKAGVDADAARFVLTMRQDWTNSQLRLHDRDEMPADVWAQFEQDVTALSQHVPAQYIVGQAPFYGELLDVDERVLIPRFETEELVAWVQQEQADARDGLDVGTGSGAIALTLAGLLPQVRVVASDVSPGALEVARANATRLGRRVTFVQSDLLANVTGEFDFIVANLPYIAHSETAVMDTSTLEYEPASALFADDDGLALIKQLIVSAPSHLKPGGSLYLEYGYAQKTALAAWLKDAVPQMQADFRSDLAGHDRMLKLRIQGEQINGD